MKPSIRPYERRRFNRTDMTTRDCGLTLLRERSGKRDRENGVLVDLSYAGMRFHGLRRIADGELLEFLVQISSSRTGFVRGHVRWVRPLGSQECECGIEFLEQSKGLLWAD